MDILDTDAYDRRQRRNTSCTLLFSLLPFFLSVALYFFVMTPDMPSSITRAGIKSVPTLLLAATVLSWNGGQSILGVAGGLVFSAIGDCCLVWPEHFIHGMVAFAVAHLLYSLTFLSGRYSPESSSSLNWFLYLIIFGIGGSFYIYMYPFLQKAPKSELIVPGVGVYILLITIMGNLAIKTRHAATLLGSLSFMVSDMLLALRVFKAIPAGQHAHTFVMVTYYLAQLLIAVGDIRAVGNSDDFAKWKRS